jgi:hypothetical protein
MPALPADTLPQTCGQPSDQTVPSDRRSIISTLISGLLRFARAGAENLSKPRAQRVAAA